MRNSMFSFISRSARRRIVCSSSPCAASVRCGVSAGRGWPCTKALVTISREPRSVRAADQRDHEVERRDASCGGGEVAVDDEDLLGDVHVREGVAEHRHRLPVQRHLAVAHNAGGREREGPGIERAEHHAMCGEAAQRGEQALVEMLRRFVAAAHDQAVRAADRRRRGSSPRSTCHCRHAPRHL